MVSKRTAGGTKKWEAWLISACVMCGIEKEGSGWARRKGSVVH